MKVRNGLTQTDVDEYDAVSLDIMILLDPFTADEARRCDYLYERIWEALLLNRQEKAK